LNQYFNRPAQRANFRSYENVQARRELLEEFANIIAQHEGMAEGDALLSLQYQCEAMFNRAIQGRARREYAVISEQIDNLHASLKKEIGDDVNTTGLMNIFTKIQEEIENLLSAPPASNVSTGFSVDNFIENIERANFQEPITANESTEIYPRLVRKYKGDKNLLKNVSSKMHSLVDDDDEVKKFRAERQGKEKKEEEEKKAAVEKKQEISKDLIRGEVMLRQLRLRNIFIAKEHRESVESLENSQRRMDENADYLRQMFERFLALAQQMHDVYIELHDQDPFVAHFNEFDGQAQQLRQEFDGAQEMFQISDATFGEELELTMRHETYRIGLRLTTIFLRFLSSYFNQERLTPQYFEMLRELSKVRTRVQTVGRQLFSEDEWDLMEQIDLHAVILEPDRYTVELFDHAYDLERFGTFHMEGILRQLNESFINVLVRSRNFAGVHGLLARFMPALERVETQVGAGAGGGGAGGGGAGGGGAETEPDDDDEGAGGQGNTTMTDAPRLLVVTATAGQGGRTVVTATRGQAQPPPGGTGRTTATRGRGAGSPSGL